MELDLDELKELMNKMGFDVAVSVTRQCAIYYLSPPKERNVYRHNVHQQLQKYARLHLPCSFLDRHEENLGFLGSRKNSRSSLIGYSHNRPLLLLSITVSAKPSCAVIVTPRRCSRSTSIRCSRILSASDRYARGFH